MLYTQDITSCLSDMIGEKGLARASHEARLKQAEAVLADLRAAYQSGALPLLRLPETRDDLASALPVADAFAKGATDIFVYGMGGSCLGGQVLAQLKGFGTPAFLWEKDRPRLHFFDNLDAQSLNEAFGRVDLRTTRFLVISKSGGTPETVSQTFASLAALEAAGGAKYAKQHFLVIAEPKTSPLRRFAERLGAPVIDHPPAVGGRYSALTVVGLVPAHIAGLDVIKLRQGAETVLRPLLDGRPAAEIPAAVGAAIAVGLAEEKGMAVSVLMPYLDRLERFAMWYRQLWAESLGKHGKGTTPVRALGPVDQHSQVQLYLEGPKDKLFTVMMGPVRDTGTRITPELLSGDAELSYLENRTVGDLVEAEARATVTAFIRSGRPVRTMTLAKLDEATMGALLMHFMLETIIAAHLMGVDPFDQPAVEQGKVLTRHYLQEMSAEEKTG